MSPRRFALLFPGQGAQSVGMGRDLAEEFPAARACFEQADRILGYPLSKICWEGPQETLTSTEQAQPALFVTSLAALGALESEIETQNPGIQWQPSAAAGLSLGEYTALTVTEAFSFFDGLRLVRLRGQAMEAAARAFPGTMASVLGLGLNAVEAICSETGAQVANINSPEQIVISGPPEAVSAALSQAKEKGAKRTIPLEVGGAFHSHLMSPAAVQLQEAFKSVTVHRPKFPVVSNVNGVYYTSSSEVRLLLVEQITHSVRWELSMRTLLAEGITTFLEVGPGTVLKGLLRKIHPEATVLSVGTAPQVREVAAQWSPAAGQAQWA